MNTKAIVTGSFAGTAVLMLALALTVAVGAFSAQNADPEARAQMKAMHASINRTVTEIDNGVEISMTSSDADTVTFLQSKEHPKMGWDDNVTVSQENIDNGVKITITSDDADTIERIQSQEGDMPFGKRKFGGRHGHFGGGMMGERGKFDSIDRTVTEISNGVEITMTSNDAETVAMLQSKEMPNMPQNDDVTKTQEIIEDGIKITVTSDDPELIARIQENEGHFGGMRRGFGGHRGGCLMLDADDKLPEPDQA